MSITFRFLLRISIFQAKEKHETKSNNQLEIGRLCRSSCHVETDIHIQMPEQL